LSQGADDATDPTSRPGTPGIELDLVIRGGKVVTPRETRIADVGILGDTIVRVGGPSPLLGKRVIEAGGLFVLPGGVDPHVHLSFAGYLSSLDDFQSGSRAAFAGGITTFGNMTFGDVGEPLTAGSERDARFVAREALADVFLHPVAADPGEATVEQAQSVWRGGHPSLKLFMSDPAFDRNFAAVCRLMRAAADASAMTLLHCEDASCLACCADLLSQQGRTGIRYFAESRPPIAEVSAVQRAIALCEVSGCPIYVVHLSSAEALRACQQARARGLPVFVETRPIYLHLTERVFATEEAGLYVAQPPPRTDKDVDALWAGLFDGSIDTIGSDHVGWPRREKLAADHDITNLKPGVADLETMLPMLFSEGVIKRGLPIERFVALTAENAARLFGLHPRKGVVAEGADADVVVWDPACVRIVSGATMQSRAGYSVYDGARVQGWPRWTIRRGQIVLSDDGVIHGEPGSGRLLLRR
jgi:dihydropyrimidinase